MTAKSVLMHPQGLRPRARAPTCPLPCYATENIARRTAIKDHLTNCDICCDKAFGSAGLNSFSVLRSYRSAFDTKINEALFIKRLKPKLNKQLYAQESSFLLNVF